MAEVRMPKMGDGMEEGTINTWRKREGEQVNAGDVIAEVETDKANVEISAYESGVLTKIVVPEGKTVPVGDVIAFIGEVTSATGNGASVPAAIPVAAETGKTPVPAGENGSARTDIREAEGAIPGAERIKVSPLARRMAQEMGLDLARVVGTGPGGRIVERDVKAYQDRAPSPVPTPNYPITQLPNYPSTAFQEIKPSRMREAIAKRTVQSVQNAPHFYVTMVIDMDRALGLLKDLNADTPDTKITINDLIVKACALALAKAPMVNATWTSDGIIRQYAEAHIGIAVGIEEGLIIPVVRDCHLKTLRQISADAKTLITKARNNQLKPEEFSGGTFSISNLGMMGVEAFTAIINPPEAAILAIGGIVREPVFEGEGDTFVVRSRMRVTLSADHRLLDGVVAARFAQEVKKALESPFALVS